MEPRYDWSSDPPLSAKGPCVRFDQADLTIRGYKAKTDYRNIILQEAMENFVFRDEILKFSTKKKLENKKPNV